MIDKNLGKEMLNDRLAEIDKLVDSLIEDSINDIIKKYDDLLEGYEYINSVAIFSTLPLKGSVRYVNKIDKKFRFGGLLIKVIQNNNKWIGILKKSSGKKYYVSFDSNYIFYKESKSDAFRNWADCFVTDLNNGIYEVS